MSAAHNILTQSDIDPDYASHEEEAYQQVERKYLGQAGVYFTPADSERGYSETRRHLAGYPDDMLIKEYQESLKACHSGNLFVGRAREWFKLVRDEMLARGITKLPNIFGEITV